METHTSAPSFDPSQFKRVNTSGFFDASQFQKVERETMALSRTRQDQILQMMEEAPIMEEASQRRDKIMQAIQEDSDAQKQHFELMMAPADAEMQNAIEAPMVARTFERQDEFLQQLEAERAEQQRLMTAMLDQQTRDQTVKLQNMAEAGLMRESRARQDKILNQVLARRKAQAEARAKAKALKSNEQALRNLSKQELSLGTEAAKARDRGDRKAYDDAGKRMEPLFKERSRLLDAIRKSDPKKADALYDELYLGR